MTDSQPRQPRGIPIGGQFTTQSHGESRVGLTVDGPTQTRSTPLLDRIFGDGERHDALLNRGYVQPTFFAAIDDPRSTARRKEWWSQHWVAGEHDADGGGFPKMPDDYTPRRTGGRALSGKRRTHRMAYHDENLTFRMPSVTSIKRFAQETGSTFDVPISADNGSGRAIAGWVRITNNGAGVWSAEGLGFQGTTNAQISEAVASVLEARRPSRGPRETGDLLERHRQRLAAQGADISAPKHNSTWISAVGYNSAAGIMFTETSTGRTYGHHVDQADFEAVRNDRSPGAIFNALIKGSPKAEVVHCPSCRRVYAKDNEHTCPGTAAQPTPGPKPQNVAQRDAAMLIADGVSRLRASQASEQSTGDQGTEAAGGGADPKAPARRQGQAPRDE